MGRCFAMWCDKNASFMPLKTCYGHKGLFIRWRRGIPESFMSKNMEKEFWRIGTDMDECHKKWCTLVLREWLDELWIIWYVRKSVQRCCCDFGDFIELFCLFETKSYTTFVILCCWKWLSISIHKPFSDLEIYLRCKKVFCVRSRHFRRSSKSSYPLVPTIMFLVLASQCEPTQCLPSFPQQIKIKKGRSPKKYNVCCEFWGPSLPS